MRKCRSISHKTTYGMHLFLLAKRSFLGEERGVPRCASLSSSPGNLLVIVEEAETGLFDGAFSLVWHNC
ncbi:hypothetical protein FNW54_17375 [Bacteroides sp. HF-5092]|nr:hypothetical protein FNW54_17375 [Bacteroides sp. HF-5092]